MPVISKISTEENTVDIRVTGRFDFSVHREFRDAYRDTDPEADYCVDLSEAEYLDSSALGMLLLLHEHAGGQDGRVVLKVEAPQIRKILTIAKFDRLFTIV